MALWNKAMYLNNSMFYVYKGILLYDCVSSLNI